MCAERLALIDVATESRRMSANGGTKRTYGVRSGMSAFGGKAENICSHGAFPILTPGAQDSVLHIRMLRRNHPHGAPALAAIHYSFELIATTILSEETPLSCRTNGEALRSSLTLLRRPGQSLRPVLPSARA